MPQPHVNSAKATCQARTHRYASAMRQGGGRLTHLTRAASQREAGGQRNDRAISG